MVPACNQEMLRESSTWTSCQRPSLETSDPLSDVVNADFFWKPRLCVNRLGSHCVLEVVNMSFSLLKSKSDVDRTAAAEVIGDLSYNHYILI
jgi:hypothetical protein